MTKFEIRINDEGSNDGRVGMGGCRLKKEATRLDRARRSQASELRGGLGGVILPGLAIGGLDVLGEAFGVH